MMEENKDVGRGRGRSSKRTEEKKSKMKEKKSRPSKERVLNQARILSGAPQRREEPEGK